MVNNKWSVFYLVNIVSFGFLQSNTIISIIFCHLTLGTTNRRIWYLITGCINSLNALLEFRTFPPQPGTLLFRYRSFCRASKSAAYNHIPFSVPAFLSRSVTLLECVVKLKCNWSKFCQEYKAFLLYCQKKTTVACASVGSNPFTFLVSHDIIISTIRASGMVDKFDRGDSNCHRGE